MKDLAYEDLETEAARELAENEAYEAKCAEDELEEKAEANAPKTTLANAFVVGYLQSVATTPGRNVHVRTFAIELLTAMKRDEEEPITVSWGIDGIVRYHREDGKWATLVDFLRQEARRRKS